MPAWSILAVAAGAALLVGLTLHDEITPGAQIREVEAGSAHPVGDARFHRFP